MEFIINILNQFLNTIMGIVSYDILAYCLVGGIALAFLLYLVLGLFGNVSGQKRFFKAMTKKLINNPDVYCDNILALKAEMSKNKKLTQAFNCFVDFPNEAPSKRMPLYMVTGGKLRGTSIIFDVVTLIIAAVTLLLGIVITTTQLFVLLGVEVLIYAILKGILIGIIKYKNAGLYKSYSTFMVELDKTTENYVNEYVAGNDEYSQSEEDDQSIDSEQAEFDRRYNVAIKQVYADSHDNQQQQEEPQEDSQEEHTQGDDTQEEDATITEDEQSSAYSTPYINPYIDEESSAIAPELEEIEVSSQNQANVDYIDSSSAETSEEIKAPLYDEFDDSAEDEEITSSYEEFEQYVDDIRNGKSLYQETDVTSPSQGGDEQLEMEQVPETAVMESSNENAEQQNIELQPLEDTPIEGQIDIGSVLAEEIEDLQPEISQHMQVSQQPDTAKEYEEVVETPIVEESLIKEEIEEQPVVSVNNQTVPSNGGEIDRFLERSKRKSNKISTQELVDKAKLAEITDDGGDESMRTMRQVALLLQKEREKKGNKTADDQRRMNEALADLLRAMGKNKK